LKNSMRQCRLWLERNITKKNRIGYEIRVGVSARFTHSLP
jgi:hypothetical protein